MQKHAPLVLSLCLPGRLILHLEHVSSGLERVVADDGQLVGVNRQDLGEHEGGEHLAENPLDAGHLIGILGGVDMDDLLGVALGKAQHAVGQRTGRVLALQHDDRAFLGEHLERAVEELAGMHRMRIDPLHFLEDAVAVCIALAVARAGTGDEEELLVLIGLGELLGFILGGQLGIVHLVRDLREDVLHLLVLVEVAVQAEHVEDDLIHDDQLGTAGEGVISGLGQRRFEVAGESDDVRAGLFGVLGGGNGLGGGAGVGRGDEHGLAAELSGLHVHKLVGVELINRQLGVLLDEVSHRGHDSQASAAADEKYVLAALLVDLGNCLLNGLSLRYAFVNAFCVLFSGFFHL